MVQTINLRLFCQLLGVQHDAAHRFLQEASDRISFTTSGKYVYTIDTASAVAFMATCLPEDKRSQVQELAEQLLTFKDGWLRPSQMAAACQCSTDTLRKKADQGDPWYMTLPHGDRRYLESTARPLGRRPQSCP